MEGKDLFFEKGSAKVEGRKQFGEMIKAIRKEKFDVLLCTELSRLARNPVDAGVIVSLLDTRPGKNRRKYTFLKEIRTLDKKFKAISTDKFTLSLFLSIL